MSRVERSQVLRADACPHHLPSCQKPYQSMHERSGISTCAERCLVLCRHRYEISRLEVAEGAHDKVMQASCALQMMNMSI